MHNQRSQNIAQSHIHMNETRWYIAGGSQESWSSSKLATVDMNSCSQDSANGEGSGWDTGTFQKFQNSLKNTYFCPLYIMILLRPPATDRGLQRLDHLWWSQARGGHTFPPGGEEWLRPEEQRGHGELPQQLHPTGRWHPSVLRRHSPFHKGTGRQECRDHTRPTHQGHFSSFPHQDDS